MKRKRKRYSGACKAKVGLEATRGVKTVGQIAREYQVHPTLVTQWIWPWQVAVRSGSRE